MKHGDLFEYEDRKWVVTSPVNETPTDIIRARSFDNKPLLEGDSRSAILGSEEFFHLPTLKASGVKVLPEDF